MRIDKLNFAYGDKVIFKDFDMDVTDKKVVCIMGASGCGKTTLLNCVCGRSDHGGIIDLGGEAEGKKIAYVFQQPRLIPSLTVEDNIDYVLPRSMSKAERAAKVNNILSEIYQRRTGRQNCACESVCHGLRNYAYGRTFQRIGYKA